VRKAVGVGVESLVPDSDLAFPFIEGEAFQGQKRPDHVFSDPLGQSRIVEAWDLVEEAGLVRSSLGHQEMEMGVKIYPVPVGLNGRDDSGHQLALGHGFEIAGQGPESAAANPARLTNPLKPEIGKLKWAKNKSALIMPISTERSLPPKESHGRRF
jgi:hypothetical protein